MKTVLEREKLEQAVTKAKASGKTIAFVPTMGALHPGHMSLARLAKTEADYTVLSIFLNPLQFGSSVDLEKYPTHPDHDLRLAKESGVDLLFRPTKEEIYPKNKEVSKLVAGSYAQGLCGSERPGHFDGVVTVVKILFDLVQPDIAVFGEKDYQQLKVVQQLVETENLAIRILAGPLIRDQDGLALSSRNQRLSPEGRKIASQLFNALKKIETAKNSGTQNVPQLIEIAETHLKKFKEIDLEYIEVRNDSNLKSVEVVNTPSRVLIAAEIEGIRLIDNLLLL